MSQLAEQNVNDEIDQILNQKLSKVQKNHDWLLTLVEMLICICIVLVINGFVLGVAVISGNSMEPMLHDGDVALYLRCARKYDRKDIVLLKVSDGSDYVKRIVAVEGDTVDIDDSEGALIVNNQIVDEREFIYYPTYKRVEKSMDFPLTVPKDCVFVLGDNRTISHDSRMTDVGCVKIDDLEGRVFFLVRTSKGLG